MTVFLYSRLYCCLLLLLSSLCGVTAFATVPFNVVSMTTSTMTSALTTATVTAAATGGITNGVGTSVASILPSSLSLLLDNNEANTNILIATAVGVASSIEGGNVVEETAAVITTTVRQGGLINWDNPAESIGGAITLLYIVFSILAGIKYIVKDGWRPKM